MLFALVCGTWKSRDVVYKCQFLLFVYLGFMSLAQGYCREKELRLDVGLDVLFKRLESLE